MTHLLSFDVAASVDDFLLTVTVDQHTVYQGIVAGTTSIVCDLPQDSADHVVSITMSGKTPAHTRIDGEHNIVSDECLQFKNFKIAGVDVEQIVYKTAQYQHSFNGTGTETQDKFYGTMGCNGTVTLPFSTPVYDWIVKNS